MPSWKGDQPESVQYSTTCCLLPTIKFGGSPLLSRSCLQIVKSNFPKKRHSYMRVRERMSNLTLISSILLKQEGGGNWQHYGYSVAHYSQAFCICLGVTFECLPDFAMKVADSLLARLLPSQQIVASPLILIFMEKSQDCCSPWGKDIQDMPSLCHVEQYWA